VAPLEVTHRRYVPESGPVFERSPPRVLASPRYSARRRRLTGIDRFAAFSISPRRTRRQAALGVLEGHAPEGGHHSALLHNPKSVFSTGRSTGSTQRRALVQDAHHSLARDGKDHRLLLAHLDVVERVCERSSSEAGSSPMARPGAARAGRRRDIEACSTAHRHGEPARARRRVRARASHDHARRRDVIAGRRRRASRRARCRPRPGAGDSKATLRRSTRGRMIAGAAASRAG